MTDKVVITKTGALHAAFFLAPKADVTGSADATDAAAEGAAKSPDDDVRTESPFAGTALEDTILEEFYFASGVTSENNGFETNGITFFSPAEIAERDVFGGKFYDVGIQYRGMGYVLAFAFIPSTSKFFARMDGGSNDWDREINFKKYSANAYDPSKFPVHAGKVDGIKEDVQYTVEQLKVLASLDPVD